jgi:LmbE family N-acetylglucosaminyl deacetylase
VFELVAIAERLAAVFAETAPDVVVTHAYEGGHPDHDATAFAVHAAVVLAAASLRRKARHPPLVVEMTGYHARDGVTVRGAFLPHAEAAEAIVDLTTDERRHKRAMLEAFSSQREVLAPFVLGVAVERFRVAPHYDFASPPHRGSLHYELGALGPQGVTWRAFAKAASRALGLPHAPS